MAITHPLVITAIACGILAAAIPGVALPADGPAATSQPAPDPWLQDLQKRLNSTDAAERDAAQKELASIAALWQQPDLLQKLADATRDPELRGLFRQRADLLLARVAEKDAMNLPPISLSLHNAGLPELASGLNAALDTDLFKFNVNNGNGVGVFNVDVQKQPFWEVFRLLQEQQPFNVQNNGNGLMLYNNNLGIHNFAVSGPVLLYPVNISYRRIVNLQTTEPPNIGVNMTLGLIVDPRISVSRFTNLSITKASDEAGHNLLHSVLSNNGGGQSNIANMGFSLPEVDGMGKRMALSCDARIAIQTSFIEATQDDIENNLNKDLTLGNRTIRIAAFRFTQNTLTIQATAAQRGPIAAPAEASGSVQYRVTDSNGKSVWTFSSQGSFANSVNVPAGTTGPFRVRVRVGNKTQDLVLHFDLKDIPLP